jgi:hypothetical protein
VPESRHLRLNVYSSENLRVYIRIGGSDEKKAR